MEVIYRKSAGDRPAEITSRRLSPIQRGFVNSLSDYVQLVKKGQRSLNDDNLLQSRVIDSLGKNGVEVSLRDFWKT